MDGLCKPPVDAITNWYDMAFDGKLKNVLLFVIINRTAAEKCDERCLWSIVTPSEYGKILAGSPNLPYH